MRQTVQRKNHFYGVTVSPFGVRNGFVDYGTLMKLAGPIKEFLVQECEYDIWELINGDDILYTDTEGTTYTEETRVERISELKALISQTEKKEEIQKYQRDIQCLDIGMELDFFQYMEVPWQFAQVLQDESDEVLYYIYQTDTYVWALPYIRDPQKALTHIPFR